MKALAVLVLLVVLSGCSGTTQNTFAPTSTPHSSAPSTSSHAATTPPASSSSSSSTSSPTTSPSSSSSPSSSGNPPTTPTTHDVTVSSFQFSPATLSLRLGDAVRWTDQSGTHTATSDTGAFDSGTMSPGQTYTFTFTQPGTFTYHCQFHQQMVAQILVS